MKKKVPRFIVCFCALLLVFCFTNTSSAKIEWEIMKDITLSEPPKDIVIAPDGSTAYILCGKTVEVYSMQQNKVTDTIPLEGDFAQIAISPSGEQLFLTKSTGSQFSIISITQVYDIPVGSSPVIGKKDAPVTIYAFLDYQ